MVARADVWPKNLCGGAGLPAVLPSHRQATHLTTTLHPMPQQRNTLSFARAAFESDLIRSQQTTPIASSSSAAATSWLLHIGVLAVMALAILNEELYAPLTYIRPVPGQQIELAPGATVFVRDPSINHPLVPDTVSPLALKCIIAIGLALLLLLESTASSSTATYLRTVATWLRGGDMVGQVIPGKQISV